MFVGIIASQNAIAQTTPTSNEEFEKITEEAYVCAFPMLIGYKVLDDFFVNKEFGQYKAHINVLSSEVQLFTPNDTIAAGVNSDTPYSFSYLDLRTEPLILSMPTIEKSRYYDVQLTDMYVR